MKISSLLFSAAAASPFLLAAAAPEGGGKGGDNCPAVSSGTIYRTKPAVQCNVPGFKAAKWFQCPSLEACTCDDLAPIDVNAEFTGDTVTCSCDAATSMVTLANERDCPCGPCLDSCNTCYPNGCDSPTSR
ncbi:unnamed protein product, partial [Chrysoparadoxa australica]